MAGMVQRVAPLSFEAWLDYDLYGDRISRGELEAMRRLVTVDGDALVGRGERLDRAALEGLGLARREVDELQEKLRPAPAPEDFTLDPADGRPAEEFEARMADALPRVDRR
jgi:hypothetical protein